MSQKQPNFIIDCVLLILNSHQIVHWNLKISIWQQDLKMLGSKLTTSAESLPSFIWPEALQSATGGRLCLQGQSQIQLEKEPDFKLLTIWRMDSGHNFCWHHSGDFHTTSGAESVFLVPHKEEASSMGWLLVPNPAEQGSLTRLCVQVGQMLP